MLPVMRPDVAKDMEGVIADLEDLCRSIKNIGLARRQYAVPSMLTANDKMVVCSAVRSALKPHSVMVSANHLRTDGGPNLVVTVRR